jgi:hypothetical protein
LDVFAVADTIYLGDADTVILTPCRYQRFNPVAAND